MLSSKNEAVERYRARMKREGWVRCEVRVRREDAALVRKVATILSDPKRRAAACAALRERFEEAPPPGLKNLLATAPLEGIDIERPRGRGRETGV